jgi:hypothetical protein
MRNPLRWYGASPLHLLAMLASFGLAGYAAAHLVSFEPLAVLIWFVGAAIGHDLLLVPLYSLADRSVMAAIRHREPPPPAAGWINYVRVPAALSGLLLLVWFPLILRLPSSYHASTTLSPDPYVWHWLAVSGVLFLLSAIAFALRLRRLSRIPAPREAPARESADREEPEPAGRPEQTPAELAAQEPAIASGQAAPAVPAGQAAPAVPAGQAAPAVPAGQEPAVPDQQPPPAGEVTDPPSVSSSDAGRAIQTQDDYE